MCRFLNLRRGKICAMERSVASGAVVSRSQKRQKNVRRRRRMAKKKATNLAAFSNRLIFKGLNLVAWGGIEPPTRGFSIRCSTN